MALAVDALDHLVINVRDVEVAAAWYQRVLGMTREDFDPGPGKVRRTSMKFGQQKINLRPLSASKEEWFTADHEKAGSDDLCFLTSASPQAVADHLRRRTERGTHHLHVGRAGRSPLARAARQEAPGRPADDPPHGQHEEGAAQQHHRQAQHHAAVGPVDMGRRLAPRRKPEGAGKLEIVEPVAGPRERGEQPQSHQAAPPVPVQGIPPGDDRVALLPRPEARGGNRLANPPAPWGTTLGGRLCLASRRLPTCHLDQSSFCPRSIPGPLYREWGISMKQSLGRCWHSRQPLDPVDDALRRRVLGIAMFTTVNGQVLAIRILGGRLIDVGLGGAERRIPGADDQHQRDACRQLTGLHRHAGLARGLIQAQYTAAVVDTRTLFP
ncbi:MAG: hypothetical protein GEV13_09715 [Rhodospirillales bacterium]|nr:hypothetical protein [Rhodospirillales bacterium]